VKYSHYIQHWYLQHIITIDIMNTISKIIKILDLLLESLPMSLPGFLFRCVIHGSASDCFQAIQVWFIHFSYDSLCLLFAQHGHSISIVYVFCIYKCHSLYTATLTMTMSCYSIWYRLESCTQHLILDLVIQVCTLTLTKPIWSVVLCV